MYYIYIYLFLCSLSLSLSLSLYIYIYIYIYIGCEGNSIALIAYGNLFVSGMRYVLNILIDFLHCAENREKEFENRQIKVITYHREFELLYFHVCDMHCEPECLETPFYNTQYICASLMIHTVNGFYPIHIIETTEFLCSLRQEQKFYMFFIYFCSLRC